ncbi:MAG: 3-methyl-2-oxobutanoate hydroxymethyltransferase [Solirubrobacterales bacterium]|nr:3-methyl-2-oxobutanoate hydroxymethyltransferase [Solirubrobacterales bacterium]
MSSRPQEGSQPQGDRKPVTLPQLREMKGAGEPIVMVTAYDHPSAQVVEEAGVDMVLVGDSAAMTVLGYDSTVPVGMDEMLMLAAAVRRGLRTPFLIGDMPFGSYERSDEQAVENALRFIKEAGCDAVKLERGGSSVDRAKAIVNAGIPVMGHVGLTPQTATQLGGYKAQGKTAERAAQIADEALALQDAGCFAIVFEAVPAAFTEAIMGRMDIPVIGIGAGHDTDGQVLVFHDLLGIFGGHAAKFVKRYANVREEMISGVSQFADEVRSGAFPGPEHIYAIEPAELSEFREYLGQQRDAEETGTFSHSDWDWGP